MLLASKQNLKDQIIQILSKKGTLDVSKLKLNLEKTVPDVSIQGVYRALRTLQKEDVVVKEKKVYSLRIPWIFNLSKLVEEMEGTYLQETYTKRLLPQKDGEKRTWDFTNLLKMDDLWCQLLICMASESRTNIALSYCPHIWLERIRLRHDEQQFRKTYLNFVREFLIVGSRSKLDKYIKESQESRGREEYYLASPDEYFTKDRTKYVDIVGDFILTIKFDKDFTKEIEGIHSQAQDNNGALSINIFKLFSRKIKIKMTLKKDAKASDGYRKKFKKIFGPLD